LETLRSTLSQYYRITIKDGRVFIGTFVCIDRERNMILTNTEEFMLGQADPNTGRFVGMVMIPWRYVVKAEVETTL
ncbi:hypothetical protein BS47DRAFT_1286270, partial [Hydnum rufescens UP504]